MGRKSKFFVVNITFILIFIFGLAISFNSKALAQEIPTATPGILETATPSPVPPGSVVHGNTNTGRSGISSRQLNPNSFAQVHQTPDRRSLLSTQVNVVSGWFNIIWGDSRNSAISKPVSRYVLTNDAGESITLILNRRIVSALTMEWPILSII